MEEPREVAQPDQPPQPDPVPVDDGDAEGASDPRDAAAAGVVLPKAGDADAQAQKEREAFERITGKKLKPGTDQVQEPEPDDALPDDDDALLLGDTPPTGGKPAKSEPKAEAKDDAAAADAERLAEVKRAYLRDGYKPEQIDRIRQALGDDEFIQTGQAKAKRQGDIDQRLPGTKPEAKPKPEPKADQPPEDDAELERLLSDLYDDAAASKIREQVGRYKSDLKRYQEQSAGLVTVLAQSLMDAGVRALSDSIPQVADQRHRDALFEEMARLTPEGWMPRNQSEFNDVLKRAAYVRFGSEIQNNERARLLANNRRERSGQPTMPARGTPRGAMTREQMEYAAYRAVSSGRDPSPVVKAFRDGNR